MMHKKLTKALSLISTNLTSIDLEELPTNKYKQIEELTNLEALLKYKIKDLHGLKEYYIKEIEEMKQNLAIYALKVKGESFTDTLSVKNRRDCICNSVKQCDLIACDSGDCSIGWFHLDCVGLKEVPENEWICDICAMKMD
ncbi:PHD finger ING1 [Tubulinosema ratisbonensis]|uniref:PHD finger ING1 n=1 Tax=Tubulinosema ratisbonensis TaxID=291195 RepID=A0A437AQ32_9MICR|nr:PHD finger ING1 [Tubulinosema ratisbonensis]